VDKTKVTTNGWRADPDMDNEVNQAGGRRIVMKRTVAAMEASMIDVASNRGSGRILEYDVYSKQTMVLMAKLNFPNGMVIKKSEGGKTTLVLAETIRFRVLEIDLTTNSVEPEPLETWGGAGFDHRGGCQFHKKRVTDIRLFIDTPGAPDNISLADGGKNIWVALVCPVNKQHNPLKGIYELPHWARRLIAYLPASLAPAPLDMALAIKYNLETRKPVEFIYEGDLY